MKNEVAVIDAGNPIIVEMQSRGQAFLNRALTVVIDTPEAAENANQGIIKGKEYLASVHAQRKFFTKPLENQVDNINALFEPLAKPFETGLVELNSKVKDFLVGKQRDIEKKKQAELEKVRAEAAANAAASPAVAVQAQLDIEKKYEAEKKAAGSVKSASGTTGVRYKWTYEVVDYPAIPENYKEINDAAVKLAISQGLREIPGIRIFQEPYVAGKGGKKKDAV
jgi:hypothetical protein